MSALPIAAREARETSRRPRTYRARLIVAASGLFGVLLGLWFGAGAGSEAQGDSAFTVISIIAQLYALFAGVIVAGDAVAFERRENTLGLLFLTDLKPRDVLVGKLLSTSTVAAFGLLAFLPMLTVPVLLGGVSIERVLMMALALIVTLCFSISFGFCLSTILREGWAAVALGAATMLALGVFYPMVLIWLFMGPAESVIFPSPSAAVITLLDPRLLSASVYWQSILFSTAATAAFLTLSAVRLAYIWRDPALTSAQERRRARATKARYGNRHARIWLRRKLLNQNPLAWLANREFISSPWLLGALALGLLLQIAIWTLRFTDSLSMDDLIIMTSLILAAMHLLLFFRICVAAAYPIAEDRKSGALELLLSAPLAQPEVVIGRWFGLGRRFFAPIVLVLISEVIYFGICYSELSRLERIEFFQNLAELELTESQNALLEEVMLVFLAIANWVAAGWLGMWWGLRMKTPAGAVWATFATVALPPVVIVGILFILASLLGITSDFTGDFIHTIVICLLYMAGLTHAAVLMRTARKNLFQYFRAAAADPSFSLARVFPWRAVRHITFATVVALCIIAAGVWIWREGVTRKAERHWRETVAEYPIEKLSLTASTNSIARADNLAESPLLARYTEFHAAQRAGDIKPTARWIDFNGGRLQTRWESSRYLDLANMNIFAQFDRPFRNNSPARAAVPTPEEFAAFRSQLYAETELYPAAHFHPNARQRLLNIASILTLSGATRIRAGDSPLQEILIILRFAEGFQHDNEFLNRAIQLVFEAVGQHRFSAQEIRRLEEAFSRINLWREHHARINAETLHAIEAVSMEFHDWRQRGSPYNQLLGRLAPDGWLLAEQADILHSTLGQFPKMFDADARRIHINESFALREPRPKPPRFVPFRVRDQIIWATHAFTRTQTGLDHTLIALALEQHRLDHGGYPETLPAGLPHDIFTGEPMPYRRVPDGQSYKLYSVGWDGRDDGGKLAEAKDVVPHRLEPPGDWVWNPFNR